MAEQDIRWKQRFSNYRKALERLSKAVELGKVRTLSDLEQQGLIQAFEFTHELAWNVMKDYFIYQGNSSITGSRDASREAFKTGLIVDGEGWMEMIKSRNKSSHTYNEETAEEIAEDIQALYYRLFREFESRMLSLSAQQTDIFS
ncbi:nucleotidyltransferase substrate binding protein [Pedobacter deserti]|uniref:nucleotidyltransferase substrate binding protein n=1 Tax=Pedobacter deserti TaxID=2817382 RepID=UPI00210E86E5|nr:nucleotidyltransferase substrate binding protein [Pedobacter sp. SYSU D00382]